ncbi:MAG: septal ring lytic transglycosylase RlpA family protein [Vibrio sp.]
MNRFYLYTLLIFILAGCSSSSGRYEMSDDKAPDKPLSVEHIEDAHPQYEPYSLGGNKNYNLLGKSYSIIKDPKGFAESGKASWYGKKFHGHRTSNGEIYDMYSMTAAHKTLPIPSYVKVTNTDNGKTTIVRVNDRGPFHDGRVIDLSYAAAYKIGVVQAGTANVKIEVISVDKPTAPRPKINALEYVIQVVSSQHVERVRTLAQNLGQNLSVPSFVESADSHHRLYLGPFTDDDLTQNLLEQVKSAGYDSAFIKTLNKRTQ